MSEKVFHIGEQFPDISGHARDDFISALVDIKDSGEDVIILNFKGVNSLSSLGLAAVGKLHTQLEEEGKHLKIEGLSENLYRIFDITGLVTMLDIKAAESKEESET
ncbi:MAG: STAS domain-containing protein [Planctomycetota bacterium]|jgi:anti-anti-sigma factor